MAPTTILLVRHGETDWNRERRIQGQTDTPLNDLGREQARALAAELADERIDAVYASDLSRARETAEILAERLDLPVVLDAALRERDFGNWEGQTVAELDRSWPGAFARWHTGGEGEWQGGEGHAELAERVRGAVRRLAAAHPGDRILLVAHGGPMRILLMDAEGLPYPDARDRVRLIANCDLSRIAVENGTVRRLD
jgi:probable phosphoglycerate mutase